jgi:hypothetical protein
MKGVSFIKSHPMATVVLLATGYMVIPWTLGKISSNTGVNINLPQPGAS